MDLIERYLQAVSVLAGRRNRRVTSSRSCRKTCTRRSEEKEAGLGRKLTDAEVEAILRQRGRPVLVANGFFPQEYLIGPVLFPIYLYVVKAVLLGYVAPWALVWVGLMIYSPGYRAQHLTHSWLAAVASAWSAWWGTAFLAVGTVTLIFAILERVQAKKHFLEDWGSAQAARGTKIRTSSPGPALPFELIVNAMCVVVWASNMYAPVAMISDVRISVSPLWQWFFWLFLLVSLVKHSARGCEPDASLLDGATGDHSPSSAMLAGSALFCWLLKANILTGFALANGRTNEPSKSQHY